MMTTTISMMKSTMWSRATITTRRGARPRRHRLRHHHRRCARRHHRPGARRLGPGTAAAQVAASAAVATVATAVATTATVPTSSMTDSITVHKMTSMEMMTASATGVMKWVRAVLGAAAAAATIPTAEAAAAVVALSATTATAVMPSVCLHGTVSARDRDHRLHRHRRRPCNRVRTQLPSGCVRVCTRPTTVTEAMAVTRSCPVEKADW